MVGRKLSRGALVFALAAPLSVPAVAETADIKDPWGTEQSIWERSKLTGDWGGLRKKLEEAGINFTLNEQSELWANLFGGKRAGTAYNGLTTPSLTFDLEKLLSWKGATFFVNAYQIHGIGPSTALVGNQQLLSNIEAAPSTKLYQIWLEQHLFDDRVNIRIGQQGANDELMTSQSAQLFLNASFGYPDLLTQDLPSGGPNYPIATPMIRTRVKVTDNVTYVNAIFNGDPAGPGRGDPQLRDASGTAFRLNDPPLIFNEIWYQFGDEKSKILPGTYKFGSWVYTGKLNDQSRDIRGVPVPFTSSITSRYRGDYAFYVVGDQMIWRKEGTKDQGITLFGLAMIAPDDRNRQNFFAEGGFNWKGAIEKRPDDVLGLAFAYARTSDALRKFGDESIALTGGGKDYQSNETDIEATYLYQFTPWWTFQPDVQYVINPGASLPPTVAGIQPNLKNSLTIGVRTKVEF